MMVVDRHWLHRGLASLVLVDQQGLGGVTTVDHRVQERGRTFQYGLELDDLHWGVADGVAVVGAGVAGDEVLEAYRIEVGHPCMVHPEIRRPR